MTKSISLKNYEITILILNQNPAERSANHNVSKKFCRIITDHQPSTKLQDD